MQEIEPLVTGKSGPPSSGVFTSDLKRKIVLSARHKSLNWVQDGQNRINIIYATSLSSRYCARSSCTLLSHFIIAMTYKQFYYQLHFTESGK